MSYDRWINIIKKYPSLFLNDQFYFEIDEGWYDLIDKMCGEIVVLGGSVGKFSQIKSKYGTLRVYMDEHHSEVEDIISRYETLSGKVCEVCGEPAESTKQNGWIMTLCNICFVHSH
jgi:hypothetical protein